MNNLEKLKLMKALRQAIIARDKSRKPLEKLKCLKEVQSLRQQLGMMVAINSKDKITRQEQKITSLKSLMKKH
ncbi:hypothetical protein [Gallibacterium anatis]|uniref:hypothetical protein n=1 Tax=Gallibacterium anatis TaxID=750 RepID=UPI00254EEF1B|nr:hypothetical protein [Gallibacterium anatis]WIM82980.1 hypothetical protein QP019_04845 [Gallibacterium anatis]